MDNNENCKVKSCCSTHGCTILGAIFLIVATILTIMTLNGLGILGMFIVGLVFCCHKHLCCKMCHCGCMNNNTVGCDTVETDFVPTVKKSPAKKFRPIDTDPL